jgi:sulfatase maturation enzyme AslB (radical SAM superfamily)
VIEKCARFERREFVICSNLQNVTDELLALFDHPEVFISTSLDGDPATHEHNRTERSDATNQFLANLSMIVRRYGPTKISALPTINPTSPPDIDDLIDSYTRFGLVSTLPAPHQLSGFARNATKMPASKAANGENSMNGLYDGSSKGTGRTAAGSGRNLFQHHTAANFLSWSRTACRFAKPLTRWALITSSSSRRTIYPTDEARMLSRSGVIDLSGRIESGGQ